MKKEKKKLKSEEHPSDAASIPEIQPDVMREEKN